MVIINRLTKITFLFFLLFSSFVWGEANIQGMTISANQCGQQMTGSIWVVDWSDGNGNVDKDFDFNLNLPPGVSLTNVVGDVCGSCGFQSLNWSGNRIWGRIQSGHINAGMNIWLSGPTQTIVNYTISAYNIGGNTSSNTISVYCDDHGDAPSSYGLAGHTYTSTTKTMRIGNVDIDYENSNLSNSTATGDDNSGTNDEGTGVVITPWELGATCSGLVQDTTTGIVALSTITMDENTYCIEVPARNVSGSGAMLAGWLDWNNNGVFDNPTERSQLMPGMANVPSGTNGDVYVIWWDNIIATEINTFIRLRITNQSSFITNPFPTGSVSWGEVEDHFIEFADFGDAPDPSSGTSLNNYNTRENDNGAKHLDPFIDIVFLGSQQPDYDSGLLQNANADADELDNMADEDGLSSDPWTVVGATNYDLAVLCNDFDSSSGGDLGATVYGWIDFDQDGIFETNAQADCIDTNDGSGSSNDGIANLTFSGFITPTTTSTTYLRLRTCSTGDCATPTGTASDGEVEDYLFDIRQIDFGDAPDDGSDNTYHTLLSSDGASHSNASTPSIYLGSIASDSDLGLNQSVTADLDDTTDTSILSVGNDEDAVSGVIFDSAKNIFTLTIPCNDNDTGVDLGATVYGWIDFNQNNRFEESEFTSRECIDTDPSNPGSALLRWIDIDNVQEGTTYLRLRITDSVLPFDDIATNWDERSAGSVVNGEIEDHVITFSQESDFGDAPDSYQTLASSGGAEHGLGGNRYTIYLGNTAPDADSDGFSDGIEDFPNTALDDDSNDTSGIASGNDEDAVTGMEGLFLDSTTYQINAICNDHNGTTDLAATVYGWVDFNADGDFSDSGEFAQISCNDIDSNSDGSALLAFSGFTVSATPTTSFARLRITTDSLTANDYAGVASDGEVEDFTVIIGRRISGKVFNDLGSDTSFSTTYPFYNGSLDTGEVGIAGVVITLFDQTSGTCQSTLTDSNGDYSLAALDGHSYQLFETANETLPAPSICPPQVGAVNTDGLLINNTIADPDGYGSSSANIISLGVITGDSSNNNFADFLAPEFASCDADGYLTLRTPADLFAVDLFSGATEELAPDTTAGYNNNGLQVGYAMQTNHIIGDVSGTNLRVIALVDGDYNVHLLPITLTGSNININFNNATISDDGILYMTGGSTGYILMVDVNPASETYLQEIGRPSISAFSTADFAINPVDGKIYGLRANGVIAIYDPVTQTRDNSKSVTQVIENGTTRTYSGSHFSSSYGAIYFDQAGNMYAVNNGNYSPPTPSIAAPVLQIPIGNGASANYTATIVSNLGFTMSTNDGARCRYAPLGLDFGDAPDSFITSYADVGPHHITRGNSIWLGIENTDNDVDGYGSTDADSDDLSGTTPDDEDAFSNQVRVFINSGAGSLNIPFTNNSAKAATMYVWVDFDQNGTFEAVERASGAILASQTVGTVTVTWSGLASVVTGDTYIRLRICTDDAASGCSSPTGLASNGEIEDHTAKVIEGVFPDTTCDGIYQTSSTTGTNYQFDRIDLSTVPFSPVSVFTNQAGYDSLNGIAFDLAGGAFYGAFFDGSNTLHIALFDKQGNIVDLGMPTAAENFNIVDVRTGVITSITSGDPIIVSSDIVGDQGAISDDGQYLYLGHPNSGQILQVDLNSFTVQAINILLPDLGMTVGGGISLPFDGDWVYDSQSQELCSAEISTQTLYSVNPQTGAISAMALNFDSTPPIASSYGMVKGEDGHLYVVIDGDYDSDGNGSLDSTGQALYQINTKSKQAIFIESISSITSTYADAAGCITTATDYSDAASSYGVASHLYTDSNNNGITDFYLGNLWDSEFIAHQSVTARDDNLHSLIDEDGVIFPAVMTSGNNEITVITNQAGVINLWLDYQKGGSFESSEQLLINYPVTSGSQTLSILLDSAAMGSYSGATIARVRFCSTVNLCDKANDVEQGQQAGDGEVEDYQVWTSTNTLVSETCDSAILSHGASGVFTLEALDPTTTPPFSTNILQNPVTINDLTNFNSLNALGIHPETYLIYGIAMDTSTPERDIHLLITDQSASEVIDLGTVASSQNQTLTHNTVGTVSFSKGQILTRDVGGQIIQSAARGAVDPTGTYLYIHHQEWHQMIRIHLVERIFDVVSFSSPVNGMGGDMAFASDGYLYNPDVSNSLIYQLDVTTGTISSQAMVWNGVSPPQNGGGFGAVFMDNGIFMYAISNTGDHDLNRDGSIDFTGSAMYRINLHSGDIVPIGAMANAYPNSFDAAGCFESVDYGDTNLITDGTARHYFYDNNGDGEADYRLGLLIDPELAQPDDPNATGDDLLDIDDEDGVVMPASIVVNSLVNVDVNVTSQDLSSLKLNVWADLNGNGSYRDSGEQVVNELDVIDGTNSVQLLLPAAFTSGYNGNTTMRFRLCANADECNQPDDTSLGEIAINGEIEDYQFELINQILIRGIIFEDNAAGGGVAHDGIQSGAETGLSGFIVQAIYQGITQGSYTSGDILATTRSRGDGSYELLLPVEVASQPVLLNVIPQATWIDISESDVSAISQVQSSNVTDNQMVITANAGDTIESLDFGKVRSPRLEADNFTEIEPGQFVNFSHKLITYTSSDVLLSIANMVADPNISEWSAQIYQDANCNGRVDSGDNAITSVISAVGSIEVCILSKVYAPISAPLNAIFHYNLTALATFTDPAITNHGVTRSLSNTDTVKVSFQGAGQLKLEKKVTNITQGTEKGVSNQGRPGDILEYEIIFSNVGTGNITDISISDDTPSYTELESVVDCNNGVIPSSISLCNIETEHGVNNSGYQGNIKWILSGVLEPNSSGVLIYRVKII
ncbi:GEVED domain-containing protein [Photobacterium damselae]|uniref:GEVED domain-containing protein n=1 Tax=Photobacterium damselae TaxID=38293 RepID=UPI0040690B78